MAVGVVVVAANTTTGSQTINGPASMGSAVPKCVIFEWSRGITSGTVAAGAQIGRGAWDGTTVRSCTAATEDNVSIASGVDSNRRQSNSAIVQILRADTQAIDGEADPVSLNAGSVTITWTDALSAAFLLTVTFIWGDDWEASVGNYTGDPDINDTVTITGIPFRPRGVLFWSPLAGGTSTDAAFTAGHAAINEDGSVQGQNCHGWHCVDQPTIVTVQASEARNDAVLVRLRGNAVTGAVTEECRHAVTSGTSDGFVVQTLGGSSGMLGLYVALRNGNRRTWCGMPTLGINTTGLKTVTPGFPPGVVWGLPTMIAVGSVNTVIDTDAGIGLTVACTDTTQRNNCISAEDAATTSDSYSLSNPNFAGLNTAGVGDWAAAVANRAATTFDFNVTNGAAVDVLTGFLVFASTVTASDTEDVTDAFVFKPGMTSADTEDITEAFVLKPGATGNDTENISDGFVLKAIAKIVISETELIDEEFVTPGFLANEKLIINETVDIYEAANLFAPAFLVSTDTENITESDYLWLGKLIVSGDVETITDGFGGTRIVLRRSIQRARIEAGGAEQGIINGPHSARGDVDG